MNFSQKICIVSVFALCVSFAGVGHAADAPEVHLDLKNHVFAPGELTVPASQKIKLIIKNEDATAAEFESSELNREKVVPANGTISVYLDPLNPGTYPYFDDFHRSTTTGTIIAK